MIAGVLICQRYCDFAFAANADLLASNVSLTARALWKEVGGGSLFSGLARPYSSGYYQGPERSSGLLDDSPIDVFAVANLVDRNFFQIVINLVHHSIVALSHTVEVTEAG